MNKTTTKARTRGAKTGKALKTGPTHQAAVATRIDAGAKEVEALRAILAIRGTGGRASQSTLNKELGWKNSTTWNVLQRLKKAGLVLDADRTGSGAVKLSKKGYDRVGVPMPVAAAGTGMARLAKAAPEPTREPIAAEEG